LDARRHRQDAVDTGMKFTEYLQLRDPALSEEILNEIFDVTCGAPQDTTWEPGPPAPGRHMSYMAYFAIEGQPFYAAFVHRVESGDTYGLSPFKGVNVYDVRFNAERGSGNRIKPATGFVGKVRNRLGLDPVARVNQGENFARTEMGKPLTTLTTVFGTLCQFAQVLQPEVVLWHPVDDKLQRNYAVLAKKTLGSLGYQTNSGTKWVRGDLAQKIGSLSGMTSNWQQPRLGKPDRVKPGKQPSVA